MPHESAIPIMTPIYTSIYMFIFQEFTKQPKSSVVLKLEEQFTLDESMSRGDPIGEDLESMLEECTTLYEAVSSRNRINVCYFRTCFVST